MATHSGRASQYAALYFGIFLLALVIGLVTGMTVTPVVGVVVPLLFSLLTAGGAVFVIAGKEEPGGKAGPTERSARAGLLGKQLIAFAFGFALGLWLGVAGKYHASAVWLREEGPKPVFQDLSAKYTDLGLLAAVMELDGKMAVSGVSADSRKAVLEAVVTAVRGRADEKGAISERDASAIADILKPPAKVASSAKGLGDVLYPLAEFRRRPPGSLFEQLKPGNPS